MVRTLFTVPCRPTVFHYATCLSLMTQRTRPWRSFASKHTHLHRSFLRHDFAQLGPGTSYRPEGTLPHACWTRRALRELLQFGHEHVVCKLQSHLSSMLCTSAWRLMSFRQIHNLSVVNTPSSMQCALNTQTLQR